MGMSRREFGAASAAVAATLAGTSRPKRTLEQHARLVGRRVQRVRQSLSLSVAECAERAGLSEGEWLGVESGTEQGVVELAKAARVLDVTAEQLVFGENLPA
jgi:hypothetical protein